MNSDDVFEKVTFDLEKLSKDPKNIKDYSKFHKDGKAHIGIATPLVRKVASENFKEIRSFEKKQVFSLCERLLRTRKSGRQEIAFDWAFRLRKKYQKEDFVIFENWLRKYVNNWGGCDDLCTHAFGEYVYQFPESLPKIKEWTKSENNWFRRASAVVLIYSLRKGKYLKEAFGVAEALMKDDEDLVQKGYGWMLKEASKSHQKEIFDFVIENRKLMSRTAVRYASEKLPETLRMKVMSKS